MRAMAVKFGVTIALTLIILVASVGATTFAASPNPHAPGTTPDIAQCQYLSIVDKYTSSSKDPVSAGGYTLQVWVEFMYDVYFNHELCFARSKATITENGNLNGGTLYLHLYDCSTIRDSVSPSVPGGGGSHTYYGNKIGASCAQTTTYFVASNGYRVPSTGSADSAQQRS